MSRPRRVPLVALLAVCVAVAGCTSQRGGGSGGATEGGGRGAGPGRTLSGPPVPLGLVTTENAPVGSFPESRTGALAAVDYANQALGGVAGRPIELRTCATNGSPESSQDCANTLIGERPVAVVGGVDVTAGAALPLYDRAGIPYVGGSPQLTEELSAPDSFMLTGGTTTDLLGQVEYLTGTRKAKSVHALYVDLPGLLSAAVRNAGQILRKRGVTDVRLVAEKADAADFAPALTRVAAGAPDAIVVVFPAQACARIIQAAAALRLRAPMFYPGACATPGVATAAGGALDNAYFTSGYLPASDGASGGDADTRAYRARVPESARSPLSQASFGAVLVVRALLAAASATPTPGGLRAALRATRDHPSPMAHPFTCDRRQLRLFPAVCNTAVRLLQWRGGRFVDAAGRWLDGRELTELVD